MTELGVFARVFPVGPTAEVADAIANAGFTTTQLNLSVLGRPTLDASLTPADAGRIRADFASRNVSIWGLSGTFNAIDPDCARRLESVRRCQSLIGIAPTLGVTAVTLCTGTRDADNMWHAHPDNDSDAAWYDMRATLDALIPVAAAADVVLGIEPERCNVVSDAHAVTRLWDQLGGDARWLTVVLDPANLLAPATLVDQQRILREAFDLVGDRVGALHAKDVVTSGYSAPGVGGLDYDLVAELHADLATNVPVIAQDLAADDAPRVADFLRIFTKSGNL